MDQMLASRDRPEWSGLFTLDGTPVGLAQLAVRQGIGWIEAIAIAPAYQGRGLGRLLVGSCVDQLRARQAQTVRLLVFQSNELALRLYRRVGFGRDEVKSRWWRLLAAC
jgi:ribosomal-protein-alanine N-acetyltransferase